MNRKGYWLGFFFFVVLVVLVFASLTVGEVTFAKQHYYWVHFKAVEGLKVGDDVRLEGVVLGKVDGLELHPESGVNVRIRMNQELRLLEGSEIHVETLSIIGGNFISITRGPGPGAWDMGQTLAGRTRPNALSALGEAVEENRKTLREVMTNVRDTFAETRTLVANINAGEGTIGRLAKDPALYEEARGTLARLQKAAQDFQEVTAKVNTGDGTIARLINTDELHASATAALKDIRRTAATLGETAEKINTGSGLVGRAIHDEKVGEDFAATVEKLRVISTNLEQVTDKLRKGEGTIGQLIQDDQVVEEVRRQLQNVEKTLGRAARSRLFVGADYRSFLETEMDISRLYIRIEPDDTKYFQAGGSFLSLSADGETVRFKRQVEEGRDETLVLFDLQAMYKIPWLVDNYVGLRAGVIEGKGGGGIDLDFTIFGHEFLITAEARDAYGSVEDEDFDEEIRGPMTRAYLRTPLWNRSEKMDWYEQILYAIKAYVGVARLQDDPEFFAGVGLEYTDEDIRTLVSLISTAK